MKSLVESHYKRQMDGVGVAELLKQEMRGWRWKRGRRELETGLGPGWETQEITVFLSPSGAILHHWRRQFSSITTLYVLKSTGK